MADNRFLSVKKNKQIIAQIASPEVIRGWSFGEVTKPETINYRSYKPEKDGLFCERIFGPSKNWECSCGKYKRIRYRGVVCDRCGVEVTNSRVRRERMGHVELAVPIAHIWFFKSLPSKIGLLLGLSGSNLEKVLYYESYIVMDPKDSGLVKGTLLTEDEYYEMIDEGKNFDADMGAGAIKAMLAVLDIGADIRIIREQLNPIPVAGKKTKLAEQKKIDLIKRLRVLQAFYKSGNDPDWMILDVLPIIPPDLRPLVPLEGGRFASSDLNDLYRRVINRNNRLKKLQEVMAPEVILRNEKRMLQESVDSLFDNGKKIFSMQGEGKVPLKSLSELLKGKGGRFRQNLLGKRVDYSGRSVIIVGPELKLHQCGIPKDMALELYKPFIMRKLEEKGLVQTIKSAKKFVEKERAEVWDILEEIILDHPIFLNRAPTLHRLGIQSFYPKLVEGKAIHLHPFVCAAFNADFDGDQMAVHLPLSFEAQIEARTLMLASQNLLHPASGRPLAVPSQDVVIGLYYLTKDNDLLKKEFVNEPKTYFADANDVIMAYEFGTIKLNEPISYVLDGKVIETTTGRVIFNDAMPVDLEFQNATLDKSAVVEIVSVYHIKNGNNKTCDMLDSLKKLGYKYSTFAGITVSMEDLIIPTDKQSLIDKSTVEVNKINKDYRKGAVTNKERYDRVIDIWTHTTNDVAKSMMDTLAKDKNGFNPVYMMATSGARGSKDQMKQLAGMRGLMAKPQKKLTGSMGEIIENPILSNFKEGLTVLEYFISTHGARKGLADTALKTADAGYLTRRLVDVAQDLIITENDCGTLRGIATSAIIEEQRVISSLSDRIAGRFAQEDIYHPITDELLVDQGSYITEELAKTIENVGIDEVLIRSVLTCETERGLCEKCYGKNLATGSKVYIGEAVGTVAAQSIGEPGTQLTLRTFHTGGTAGRTAESGEIISNYSGVARFTDITLVEKSKSAVDYNPSESFVTIDRKGQVDILDKNNSVIASYPLPYASTLTIEDGTKIKKGDVLAKVDVHNLVLLAEKDGTIKFEGLKKDESFKEIIDEKTAVRSVIVIEGRKKKIHPHILVVDSDGQKVASHSMPTDAVLSVVNKVKICAGDIIAKIPRNITKSRDITGGLPRVAELFEARRPADPAVFTAVEGIVSFGGLVRNNRKIVVTDENDEVHEFLVAQGKHLRVREGDLVSAGEKLSEGPEDPHDILRIKGEAAVQNYLVNEIQAVYRIQGVAINDKHIECIVRQMLRKVQIVNAGTTTFVEGDSITKVALIAENRRVIEQGGKPAVYKSMLLGITKSSLGTDSFISAASFQETSRVLCNASIAGSVDKLHGLKENVIIGNLIPAGTGSALYSSTKVKDLEVDNVLSHDENSDEFLNKMKLDEEDSPIY